MVTRTFLGSRQSLVAQTCSSDSSGLQFWVHSQPYVEDVGKLVEP
jgi:hypothetical protein